MDDMNALDALLPLVENRQSLVVDDSDDLEVARLVRLAQTALPAVSLTVLGNGNAFRTQS